MLSLFAWKYMEPEIYNNPGSDEDRSKVAVPEFCKHHFSTDNDVKAQPCSVEYCGYTTVTI